MFNKGLLFNNRKELVIGVVTGLTFTLGLAQSTVVNASNNQAETVAISKRIVDSGVVNLRSLDVNDYNYTFNVYTKDFELSDEESSENVVEFESELLEQEKEITAEVNNLVFEETLANQAKLITEEELCARAEYNVPNDVEGCMSNKKTYMKYQLVTAKDTAQYKLLYGEDCYTDMNTGIRMVDGRYCIAIGTGFNAQVGNKVDLVLEDNSIVKCIVAEVKSDAHTDAETHTYHVGGYDKGKYYVGDGSVAEFVVDGDVYFNLCDTSGSVNWVDGLSGKILKVVVIPDDMSVLQGSNV